MAAPAEDVDDLFEKKKKPARTRIEYYAEEQFQGANLKRSVHIGWGACIGAGIIFFCMGMSAVTQSRSWNVSFRWLQRRVGAQFGTMAYIITSNTLYYHDGDKWVTRPWADLTKRWQSKTTAAARPPPLGWDQGNSSLRGEASWGTAGQHGFAAGGVRDA